MTRITRLFVRHVPQPAELALIFGSAVPEEAERRARHAAQLYLGDLVPRILFSGGAVVPGEAESVRMASVARGMGVPESAILVEPFSRTTAENIACSLEILRQGGLLEKLRRVLLVSCSWHMGRILRLMKGRFPPEVELLACPQQEDCTAESWQQCPRCRERVLAEADLLEHFINAGVLPAEL